MLWRRRRSACLFGRGRTRHGDGPDPSLCGCVVGLWHGARGPGRVARRAGGGSDPVGRFVIWTAGAEHVAPVFDRTDLRAGDHVAGPALIREANATTVVEPGWRAEVTDLDHMLLRRAEPRATRAA